VPDEAVRRAAALTAPDNLFSHQRLGEVYRLLPVAYDEGDDNSRAALLARIEQGPDPSSYGLPDSELEEHADAIALWQDEWRQRLLAALEPQLDDEERQRLQALRDHRGEIDSPGFSGITSTSWFGPASPRDAVQLAGLDQDELVALLRDFRADSHAGTPTPEGLGRELARGRVRRGAMDLASRPPRGTPSDLHRRLVVWDERADTERRTAA